MSNKRNGRAANRGPAADPAEGQGQEAAQPENAPAVPRPPVINFPPARSSTVSTIQTRSRTAAAAAAAAAPAQRARSRSTSQTPTRRGRNSAPSAAEAAAARPVQGSGSRSASQIPTRPRSAGQRPGQSAAPVPADDSIQHQPRSRSTARAREQSSGRNTAGAVPPVQQDRQAASGSASRPPSNNRSARAPAAAPAPVQSGGRPAQGQQGRGQQTGSTVQGAGSSRQGSAQQRGLTGPSGSSQQRAAPSLEIEMPEIEMDDPPGSFEVGLPSLEHLPLYVDPEPPSFEDFRFTAEEVALVLDSAKIQSRGKDIKKLMYLKRPQGVPDRTNWLDEVLNDTETSADALAPPSETRSPLEGGAGSLPVPLQMRSPPQASGGAQATLLQMRSPPQASGGSQDATLPQAAPLQMRPPGQSNPQEVAIGLDEVSPMNIDSAADLPIEDVFISDILSYCDDLSNPEPFVVDALRQAGYPTPGDPGWEEFLETRGRKGRPKEPERWQPGDFGDPAHPAFTVERALDVRTPFHNAGANQPPDLHPTDAHMVQILDWMRYLIALQRTPRHFLHEENGIRLGRIVQSFNQSWKYSIQRLQLDPADLSRNVERATRLRDKVRREEFGFQKENRPGVVEEYEQEMTRWTSYLRELRRSFVEYASEESRQSFMALVEAFNGEFDFTIKALLGEELALSALDVEQGTLDLDVRPQRVALGWSPARSHLEESLRYAGFSPSSVSHCSLRSGPASPSSGSQDSLPGSTKRKRVPSLENESEKPAAKMQAQGSPGGPGGGGGPPRRASRGPGVGGSPPRGASPGGGPGVGGSPPRGASPGGGPGVGGSPPRGASPGGGPGVGGSPPRGASPGGGPGVGGSPPRGASPGGGPGVGGSPPRGASPGGGPGGGDSPPRGASPGGGPGVGGSPPRGASPGGGPGGGDSPPRGASPGGGPGGGDSPPRGASPGGGPGVGDSPPRGASPGGGPGVRGSPPRGASPGGGPGVGGSPPRGASPGGGPGPGESPGGGGSPGRGGAGSGNPGPGGNSPGRGRIVDEAAALNGVNLHIKIMEWTKYLCVMRHRPKRLLQEEAASTLANLLNGVHEKLNSIATMIMYFPIENPEVDVGTVKILRALIEHRNDIIKYAQMHAAFQQNLPLISLQVLDEMTIAAWVQEIVSLENPSPIVIRENQQNFVVAYHTFYDEIADVVDAILGSRGTFLKELEPIRRALALDAELNQQQGQQVQVVPDILQVGLPQPMQGQQRNGYAPRIKKYPAIPADFIVADVDPHAEPHPASEDQVPEMYRYRAIVNLFETSTERYNHYLGAENLRDIHGGKYTKRIAVPQPITAQILADEAEYHILVLKELKRLQMEVSLAMMGTVRYTHMPTSLENDLRFYIIAYHKFIRCQVDHCDHACPRVLNPQECCYNRKLAPLNAILDREELHQKMMEKFLYDITKIVATWCSKTKTRCVRHPAWVQKKFKKWIREHDGKPYPVGAEWKAISVDTGLEINQIQNFFRGYRTNVVHKKGLERAKSLIVVRELDIVGHVPKKPKLPEAVENFLTGWMRSHREYCYPIKREMKALQKFSRLNKTRLKAWMAQYRRKNHIRSTYHLKNHHLLEKQGNGRGMAPMYRLVGAPIEDPQIVWSDNEDDSDQASSEDEGSPLNNEGGGGEEDIEADDLDSDREGHIDSEGHGNARIGPDHLEEALGNALPAGPMIIEEGEAAGPPPVDRAADADLGIGPAIEMAIVMEAQERRDREQFQEDFDYEVYAQRNIPKQTFVLRDGQFIPAEGDNSPEDGIVLVLQEAGGGEVGADAQDGHPVLPQMLEGAAKAGVEAAEIEEEPQRAELPRRAPDPILPAVEPHAEPEPGPIVVQLVRSPLLEARNEIEQMDARGQLPAAVADEAVANLEIQEEEPAPPAPQQPDVLDPIPQNVQGDVNMDAGVPPPNAGAPQPVAGDHAAPQLVDQGPFDMEARRRFIMFKWEPTEAHATNLMQRAISMIRSCLSKKNAATAQEQHTADIQRLINSHLGFSRREPVHSWEACVAGTPIPECCYNARFGEIDNIEGEQQRLASSLFKFDVEVFRLVVKAISTEGDRKARIILPGFIVRWLDEWCAANVPVRPLSNRDLLAVVEREIGASPIQTLSFIKRWKAECLTVKIIPAVSVREMEDAQRTYLRNWFEEHLDNSYPDDAELTVMCRETGLERLKVLRWLNNYRLSNSFRKIGVDAMGQAAFRPFQPGDEEIRQRIAKSS